MVRRLGAGGMGEVFLAKVAGRSEPVVVKRILPHLVENPRFLRLLLEEVRIAARLLHPNIARIFELGEADGTWFVSMEWVDGRDLRDLFKRAMATGYQVPLELALRVGVEVAGGLHHAHTAQDAQGKPLKIVHRDVSPHNVLLSRHGQVKLIDFGVAKAANKVVHTAAGILKGKFPYMAPEQANAKKVDARTDVFALGIVLWELVTGKHLFRGKSDAGTLRLVRACEVPPPSNLRPNVPPELDKVLLKALSLEPRKRYPDARAMQEALQEILVGLPPADIQRFVYMFDERGTDELEPALPEESQSNTELDSPASQETMDFRASPETRSERSGFLKPGAPIFKPPRASAKELTSTADLLTRLTGPLTNLAPRVSSFVGRVAELADLHQLIRQGSRLVTLLGPGGTGKTRLAQQLAQQLVAHYSRGGEKGPKGGVWFCDLADARDADGVCVAVAKALGVPLGRIDAVTQLTHAISARGEVLLVLDNFEQVVAAASETVEVWLQRAESARFVVTSRELLKIAGEAAFEVPPLRTPQQGEAPRSSEAVQLFIERAHAVRADWDPTPTEEAAIGQIVQQLDGLPLAIELAAGRVGVLSPSQLVQRLPRRFDLLSMPSPAAERQTTLRGAIDWSWNMLSPEEGTALAQLAVFRGGFTAEAAEAVIDLSGFSSPPDALSVLLTLRSKSLVRSYYAPGSAGENRYGLLESIREYAHEKLVASGQLAAARERHARFYIALGGRLSAGAEGSAALLDALELERENLNSVFQRGVENGGKGPRALRAVLALDPLLALRGPFRLHPAMLDAALAALGDADPHLRALGLEARGRVLFQRGRLEEASADITQMLELAKKTSQAEVEGRALSYLGTIERLHENVKEARRWYEAALVKHRQLGDRRMEGRTLTSLGSLLDDLGQTDEALQVWAEALEIHRAVGDRRYEGITLNNLGVQQQNQGQFTAAKENYLQAQAIHRELGNRVSEGIAQLNLGDLHRDLEKAPQALNHYQSALAILREAGARMSEGRALAALGSHYQETGNIEEAIARYREAVRVLREVGDKRYEGLTLGALAAALAGVQTMGEADQLLEDSTRMLNEAGDLNFLDALDVYRAHVELAKAMQHPKDGRKLLDTVQKRVRRAEQPHDPDDTHPNGLASPADRSEHVRAALRSLRAAMRRTGVGRR
ncbi:MAG: protein kinase [Myxococcaceae bacterium]